MPLAGDLWSGFPGQFVSGAPAFATDWRHSPTCPGLSPITSALLGGQHDTFFTSVATIMASMKRHTREVLNKHIELWLSNGHSDAESAELIGLILNVLCVSVCVSHSCGT